MIGPSFDDVHRELVAEDPEYEAIYRETHFEDGLALGLAELRHERELTQRQLADKLALRQPMIARIEKGAQIPTATTLFRLATVLQARIEITPDGATVTQYAPQQQVDLAASHAPAYVPAAVPTGMGPSLTVGSIDLGYIATSAIVNAGQVANQGRLQTTVPEVEGLSGCNMIDAWKRSMALNQEPVRELVAAPRPASTVPSERSAA